MNPTFGRLEAALELARRGKLYPAVILSGGTPEARQEAAVCLARTLLCEALPAQRPCGACRHCQRVVWPQGPEDPFHPDFRVQGRDRKTATSAEAVRELVSEWQYHPFEARGQVFVIAEAESLSAEAGDALLKALEEPGMRSPRHFLLLAPAAGELPATLRSRSLKLYLGPAPLPEARAEELSRRVRELLLRYRSGKGSVWLLGAAEVLTQGADFSDPRNSDSFHLLAKALLEVGLEMPADPPFRRALFELAQDFLEEAPVWRLRGAPAERIILGLVSERLAGFGGARNPSSAAEPTRPSLG